MGIWDSNKENNAILALGTYAIYGEGDGAKSLRNIAWAMIPNAIIWYFIMWCVCTWNWTFIIFALWYLGGIRTMVINHVNQKSAEFEYANTIARCKANFYAEHAGENYILPSDRPDDYEDKIKLD